MRIDVLSIFPDYLAPLELSLPGKARDKGLLELHVHDLRQWAHDRHRTVDDTPYGGGAGMVMKPEPWGEAFDELGVDEQTTVVFTTPSGEPFSQALAQELSTRERLVFACGRYEGIDQRVIDDARERAEVREISSATTCSTGERWPRWRSPRPWSG
jgi:tRNA (guanine37-N1)-methyltransferase